MRCKLKLDRAWGGGRFLSDIVGLVQDRLRTRSHFSRHQGDVRRTVNSWNWFTPCKAPCQATLTLTETPNISKHQVFRTYSYMHRDGLSHFLVGWSFAQRFDTSTGDACLSILRCFSGFSKWCVATHVGATGCVAQVGPFFPSERLEFGCSDSWTNIWTGTRIVDVRSICKYLIACSRSFKDVGAAQVVQIRKHEMWRVLIRLSHWGSEDAAFGPDLCCWRASDPSLCTKGLCCGVHRRKVFKTSNRLTNSLTFWRLSTIAVGDFQALYLNASVVSLYWHV